MAIVDATHQISVSKVSSAIGLKNKVEKSSVKDVERITGYNVGGVSPFGTKQKLPIYLDSNALKLKRFFINGGSRGFIISLFVKDFIHVMNPFISDLCID